MSTNRMLFRRGLRSSTGLRRNTGLFFLILIATLSTGRHARAAEVLLDAPYTSYVSGRLSTGVAAGDVNGDGHVDLVSCNDEGVASIFLGQGDGTLDPSGEVVVGTGGRYVALADLDLDGRLDLVVARSTALTVARGNGDGSFAASISYATNGVNTNRIVQVADLDFDGRLDLVTNEGGNGTLWHFPGNGDGTFAARQALTPQASFQFILADLNGDGRLDFLRTVGGPLTVQLGNGNGTFGTPTDYPAGTLSLGRAAVEDLNHDGKLDVTAVIAQGQSLENSVAVFLGDGAGSFGAAVRYPVQTNPKYAVVADLDGDGMLDVATVNLPLSNGGTLSMLRGRGDGTFDPSRDYPCGTDARWPATADLNEDGKSDVAVPSRFGTSLLIYRANAGASFGSAVSIRIGAGPAGVESGDINADGRPDLVTTFYSGDSLAVVLANGSGTFGAPTAFAAGVSTGYLELGDLNGDGKLDLVSSPREDVADASVLVRIGLGNGSFLPPVTWAAGTTPAFIEIEDLNEDGRPDLLVSNFGNFTVPDTGHTVSLLLGNGDGTFAAPVSFETGLRPYGLAVADLNADGHDDVAVVNHVSQSISILLGNGDGTFGPHTDYPVSSSIYRLAVADVNEDGAPDIVYDGEILLGTGDGSFSLSPFTFSLYVAGLEDLDVDGHLDLMVLDFYSNALRIARGSGNGEFAAPPSDFGLGSSIGYPAFDDFNGDGLLDVVTANSFLNDLAVVFNQTPGLVSVPVTPAMTPGALRVLPNPVRGGDLVVEFASAARAPSRIELFDLAGRRIVAREIAAGEPGTHRLRVTDRGRLEAGIYFLRLDHAGRTSTARAIVLD